MVVDERSEGQSVEYMMQKDREAPSRLLRHSRSRMRCLDWVRVWLAMSFSPSSGRDDPADREMGRNHDLSQGRSGRRN